MKTLFPAPHPVDIFASITFLWSDVTFKRVQIFGGLKFLNINIGTPTFTVICAGRPGADREFNFMLISI